MASAALASSLDGKVKALEQEEGRFNTGGMLMMTAIIFYAGEEDAIDSDETMQQ